MPCGTFLVASHTHTVNVAHLIVEREWDMALPGFVDEEKAPATRIAHPTMGHQTRVAHATRAATAAAAAAAAAAATSQGTGPGASIGHQGHHHPHHR